MINLNNPGFELERNMNVKTAHDYLRNAYKLHSDNDLEYYIEDHYDEFQMLREIIALDVSIYILRRTNCVCGSNIATLRDLYSKKKMEYKDKFVKAYIDFNSEVDY